MTLLPSFLPLLRVWTGAAARVVGFAILTAAKSGEVRGLTRRELDGDAKVWLVPRERMKAKRPHRVPLSAAALAFLASCQAESMTSQVGALLREPGRLSRLSLPQLHTCPVPPG